MLAVTGHTEGGVAVVVFPGADGVAGRLPPVVGVSLLAQSIPPVLDLLAHRLVDDRLGLRHQSTEHVHDPALCYDSALSGPHHGVPP